MVNVTDVTGGFRVVKGVTSGKGFKVVGGTVKELWQGSCSLGW